MPYLRDVAEGRSGKMPADSMLGRSWIARTLNRLMGTTRFDAWNIDQIPSEDLTEIRLSLQWLDELRSDG